MVNFLLDTCILIDLFRGKEQAVQFFGSLENPPFLSALTLAELYAGVREGKERTALDNLAQHLPVIPLTEDMAIKGGYYRQQYGKSHGVGIMDALIASSAEQKELTLVTRNLKHFPMLKSPLRPY